MAAGRRVSGKTRVSWLSFPLCGAKGSGQDWSYGSTEHEGSAMALLFQAEAPRGQSRGVCVCLCVCVQMRWQHMFADNMPVLHQAPAGILLSAELIGILFNNPLFSPFRRVKHTLLFVLINGSAGRYLPTLLRK